MVRKRAFISSKFCATGSIILLHEFFANFDCLCKWLGLMTHLSPWLSIMLKRIKAKTRIWELNSTLLMGRVQTLSKLYLLSIGILSPHNILIIDRWGNYSAFLNKLTAAARHSYTYNNIDTNYAAENVQLIQIMYLSSLCEQRDPAKELFYKVQRSVRISCANQPIPACKSIANSIRCSTNLPRQAALRKSSLSTSLRQMTQNLSAFPK